MRHILSAILLGLALLPLAAPAATPTEHLTDFATGIALETPGAQPFYRVELPLAVYAQARADLGDLRVFNVAGEAVPYGLTLQAPAASLIAKLASLPFFPVRGSTPAAIDQIDLDIRQSRDGRLIALRSTGNAANESRIVAYLFDLSALEQPLQALRLDWPASAEGYSGEVRVEASDDLRHWRAVADATLLDIRFAGQRLQQKRIALERGQPRYLRLTTATALPELSRAEAELLSGTTPASPALRWHEVTARPGEAPGDYVVDLGARLTVTQARILLPQPNTVAPLELLVRERRKDEWRPVARTNAYRIFNAGSEATSPALDLDPQAGRYWLLRVDPRAGSLGSGMPILRLGWTPAQLVFLARGTPPFTLAFGQRSASGQQLPLESLLPGYRAGAEAALPVAAAGMPRALGGHDAPPAGQEDHPPTDWKRWLLWGILLAGVGLLALMARTLLRQMPEEKR
jgi:hypothetical protein